MTFFTPGSILELDVEKPVAGGRMLARHGRQIVLVRGAIPGERIRARVERSAKSLIHADTAEVIEASPDRRPPAHDTRCGGAVFAHIAYARQPMLKGQILQDALSRIGRLQIEQPPPVVASPEHGYRMRARLHAARGRLGFFREGTHELCDPAPTGQLLPGTIAWLQAVQHALQHDRLDGLAGLELAENVSGEERACHLLLHAGANADAFTGLADGLTGMSASHGDEHGAAVLAGVPFVSDVLHPGGGGSAVGELTLRRSARAFFQGNRYLLEQLVRHVLALVPPGPAIDLYAGVGLFGLARAASCGDTVTLVEGDPVSGEDLAANAGPFADRARVERRSVEDFLAEIAGTGGTLQVSAESIIVDPPRTGLSREAVAGLLRVGPGRLVYISCDVATFARDARTLLDSGYRLDSLTAFDLFPNTAHVETVAAFDRG